MFKKPSYYGHIYTVISLYDHIGTWVNFLTLKTSSVKQRITGSVLTDITSY